MQFEKMNRKQQESFLMPILIQLLRKLGGESSRKELREELRVSVTAIPESIIDEIRPAKSGGKFRPFDFVFNFSIKRLYLAGFFATPKRGVVTLTQKGREADSEYIRQNIEKEIYQLSDPYFEEKSKQRLLKKPIEEKENFNEISDNFYEENELDISHNWKQQLQIALFNMPSHKFEIFCRALVKKMGVDIDESKGVSASRDGGLDGYGYITSDEFRTARVAIQAKRWNDHSKVGTPEIDKFAGAMSYNNAEFGIFITTSDFSRDAIERARSGQRPITLINGDKIIELVEKYQLYIKPVTTFELESFYTEEN
ncbi:TPA: restriction endonuclease [Mannheimia haemolytica]